VSQVKSLALVKNVVDKDEGERGESLRATLFIILTLIFMQYMEAGAPEGTYNHLSLGSPYRILNTKITGIPEIIYLILVLRASLDIIDEIEIYRALEFTGEGFHKVFENGKYQIIICINQLNRDTYNSENSMPVHASNHIYFIAGACLYVLFTY
jgi:hypothetical protein